ncbi:MAG: DegV family protein [Anaerolineales bacterium]
MSKKTAILTDSTAYIPDELLAELDIHTIPLIINWDDNTYLDNVDITPDIFFDRLVQEKNLPTTSQPSAGAFKERYEELAKDYDGIVAILISSGISGTVASAQAAAERVDFPVEVVDSKLAAMSAGLMVLAAARTAKAGGPMEEIVATAKSLVDKVKVMFVVDTLEFLHKGGRIGGAKRLVGSLLSMKPILHLVDGKIDALDSVRTKKKAVQTMVSIFEADAVGKDKIHLAVFHSTAEDEANKLMEQIKETHHLETAIVAGLSPVIGVHTGPGTIALTYYFD